MKYIKHFIDGSFTNATPISSQSINPSDNREVVVMFPEGTSDDINYAVDAARRAFPKWSNASPEFRADTLDRVGALILDRRETIATLLAREEGKTLAEAMGETTRAARVFKYFAGEAIRLHGQNLDSIRVGVSVHTRREPVGVFALVIPWNFPIAIPSWKVAPALAFGNTVVMKPSELTPAMGYAFAEILHEAGVPPGVFNLVLGGKTVGEALVAHSDVDAISFTGSQIAGAKIVEAAAKHQARLQMEMGGKNPLVILDDANFDRAVQVALDGGYFNTGQRCTASSRLLVQEGIYQRFVAALTKEAEKLNVGPALDPHSTVGPVVSEGQLSRILEYVEIAKKEGGTVITGGKRLALGSPGNFMSPTLIVDTAPDMRINCEEVFGPVVSIIKIKDYEEGLAISNAGKFGLSAGIVTSSLKYATHYQRNVKAGMVMVNLPTAGVDYHVPFGGIRSSSYGAREQGFAAAEFFTQVKTSYCHAGSE